jgi:FlaG/FlaF family flagellin (archaellin)
MGISRLLQDECADSPAIGVILMVTVILSAVDGTFVPVK